MSDHYDGVSEPMSRAEKEAMRRDEADYDALAARLAEAERHLRNMYAMVHGKVPPDHPFTLSNVSDFLRLNPADESTASSASDALP